MNEKGTVFLSMRNCCAFIRHQLRFVILMMAGTSNIAAAGLSSNLVVIALVFLVLAVIWPQQLLIVVYLIMGQKAQESLSAMNLWLKRNQRIANNAEWGYDYLMRTSKARSNMYDNRPNETQYFYTDGDSQGVQLEGQQLYSVTFPDGELPPVNGFWSMTIYNHHHLFEVNDLNRYSLGTKNQDRQYNSDGSLTLYVGKLSPGADKETNWVPAPEETFSLYIRAYWGKEAILDGSWIPPVIEKMK